MSKRTTPPIKLTYATNKDEALFNLNKAQEWARLFITESVFWEQGNKTAGVRARACLRNLKRNSAVINKSMIDIDKEEL